MNWICKKMRLKSFCYVQKEAWKSESLMPLLKAWGKAHKCQCVRADDAETKPTLAICQREADQLHSKSSFYIASSRTVNVFDDATWTRDCVYSCGFHRLWYSLQHNNNTSFQAFIRQLIIEFQWFILGQFKHQSRLKRQGLVSTRQENVEIHEPGKKPGRKLKGQKKIYWWHCENQGGFLKKHGGFA